MEEQVDVQKIRCLILSENKDFTIHGFNEYKLDLWLSEDSFHKKIEDFIYLRDFIIHMYVADTLVSGVMIGVNRFEKCRIIEYDKQFRKLSIAVRNKKFYNMSETKLLRKDKIGNYLLMSDLETPLS